MIQRRSGHQKYCVGSAAKCVESVKKTTRCSEHVGLVDRDGRPVHVPEARSLVPAGLRSCFSRGTCSTILIVFSACGQHLSSLQTDGLQIRY